MRKMTEGRMMMKGRKWTGMNKEATKPYLKEEKPLKNHLPSHCFLDASAFLATPL